jgi:glycosyltransferase involved in cell wall biosynthesis
MNILHVEALPYPHAINGMSNTVWLLAREQARQGHRVVLLVRRSPTDAGLDYAESAGIDLVWVPWTTWRYDSNRIEALLRDRDFDIVNLHSVFQPKQVSLACQLNRFKIPYVVTPHGGLDFRRSRLKKLFFVPFLECPRFYKSAAITTITPRESRAVRRLVPRYRHPIRCLFDPIDTESLAGYAWKGEVEAKRVTFLGRFDVLQKGIDLVVEVARSLPEVEFYLYGSEEPKNREQLQQLQRDCTANIHFCDPVYGEEKARVLSDSSLYLQMSRWDGFGLSVAEAMYLGVPCAIAETLNLAEVFQERDLGAVLSAKPAIAAQQLRAILQQGDRLWQWSKRGQSFARSQFQPDAVAAQYLELYREVLQLRGEKGTTEVLN